MVKNRILKNLIDLATGTFVSRILGFIRELITAAYYGTGKAMDLFVIAFTIPTFFRRFLGEDVVERAFMPPFKKLISQKKYSAGWQLLSSCLNIMVLTLIVLMILCYLIAPLLVKAIAPGLEEQYFQQALYMTYWILPFMLLIGLASFVGGILNFFEMNKIYSMAPAVLSIGVMIGILFFKAKLGIYALAAGFLLGGFLELIIQVPYLLIKKIRKDTQAQYRFEIQLKEHEFRKVSRESGFILLKSLLDKSVEIVGRMLASYLASGSIAALWYSQRLFQLPVAIFGLAISRSLIPFLTEKKALTQENEFINGIKLGIRMNFALILPTTTLMVIMAKPIISIVYERGLFNANSTELTGIAFYYYALGLLGLALNTFFARIFSIFQKNKIPFYISIGTSILNILLNFVLVKTPLEHGGIALASSISFSVNSLILFYYLYKELDNKVTFRFFFTEFAIMSGYCIIAGYAAHLIYLKLLIPNVSLYVTSFFIQKIICLLVVMIIIGSIFYGMILIFGPEQIKKKLLTFF